MSSVHTLPHPLLLRPAEPTRSAAPHPRLARGGPGCRVHTTADVLAILGERPVRRTTPAAVAALAALSAGVDRAAAEARL